MASSELAEAQVDQSAAVANIRVVKTQVERVIAVLQRLAADRDCSSPGASSARSGP